MKETEISSNNEGGWRKQEYFQISRKQGFFSNIFNICTKTTLGWSGFRCSFKPLSCRTIVQLDLKPAKMNNFEGQMTFFEVWYMSLIYIHVGLGTPTWNPNIEKENPKLHQTLWNYVMSCFHLYILDLKCLGEQKLLELSLYLSRSLFKLSQWSSFRIG